MPTGQNLIAAITRNQKEVSRETVNRGLASCRPGVSSANRFEFAKTSGANTSRVVNLKIRSILASGESDGSNKVVPNCDCDQRKFEFSQS